MKEQISRYLDIADYVLCRYGPLSFPSWKDYLASNTKKLYAGKLRRALPQFATHFGVTPFYASTRNIKQDVAEPFPARISVGQRRRRVGGPPKDAQQSQTEYRDADGFVRVDHGSAPGFRKVIDRPDQAHVDDDQYCNQPVQDRSRLGVAIVVDHGVCLSPSA